MKKCSDQLDLHSKYFSRDVHKSGVISYINSSAQCAAGPSLFVYLKTLGLKGMHFCPIRFKYHSPVSHICPNMLIFLPKRPRC